MVVSAEDIRRHVRTSTDDVFRNVAVQTDCDPAVSERVRTHRRRATERGGVLHRVTYDRARASRRGRSTRLATRATTASCRGRRWHRYF